MDISTKDLMECFINPTKSSILLAIQQHGAATAKELMAREPEIPQATLYRTLKQLTTLGIIEVVSEKKIRAVIEKTYDLNNSLIPNIDAIITENNGPAYFQLMAHFTMQLMAEFKAYAERPAIDILHDGSGFSAGPIFATDEELQELGQRIAEVVNEYRTKSPTAETEQKLHTLAVIFTPPHKS